MKEFIATYFRDEAGAAAAEYALILAVVTGVGLVGVSALGGKIAGAITAVSALFP